MVTRLMIRQFTTKLSETAATTKTSRARGQARLLDHAEPPIVASHIPEAAVRGDDHLADTDALGRQREHAELLGLRVQTRDCIGLDLVDPHRTCRVHGDGVRAAVLPGRKRVLLTTFRATGSTRT